jgi:hypothetical protein
MKGFTHKTAFLLVALFFIFSVQIFAQLEGNPENWCRNGFFPRESSEYKQARIKGKTGEKIYFYGDRRDDCPSGKGCRTRSYIVPGDEVIVSRALGNFACAWYQPRKGGETVGWIETRRLETMETNDKPDISAWLGKWKFYENSIEITRGKTSGLLTVTGDAIWRGTGDNVHIGELDHESSPRSNVLNLGETETDEYACRVTMRLVGRFLIVSDNLNCGGAGVTFSGVYRK